MKWNIFKPTDNRSIALPRDWNVNGLKMKLVDNFSSLFLKMKASVVSWPNKSQQECAEFLQRLAKLPQSLGIVASSIMFSVTMVQVLSSWTRQLIQFLLTDLSRDICTQSVQETRRYTFNLGKWKQVLPLMGALKLLLSTWLFVPIKEKNSGEIIDIAVLPWRQMFICSMIMQSYIFQVDFKRLP